MLLFSTPQVMLILALMIVLHFLSIISRGTKSRILTGVNICLHIVAIIPLINFHFEMEEAVLVYMISLFFFTLLSLIVYKRREARALYLYRLSVELLAKRNRGRGGKYDV